MPKALRIVLAIATLLTTLGFLGLAIYALTAPHIGLFIVCMFMVAGFGVFNYIDYKYFFGKKANETGTQA